MSTSQASRTSLPIFLKCLILIAAICAVLSTALTVLSLRTSGQIAIDAARSLGASITVATAQQIAAPLKFGDTDQVENRLEAVIDSTDLATLAVVVAQGAVVAQQGKDSDLDAIETLARQAADTGEEIVSPDGLLVGVPIFGGKDGTVLGGLGVVWSPAALEATVADDLKLGIAVSAAIALIMSALGTWAVRHIVTSPLNRIIVRTSAMAQGDFASSVPYLERGDEIGKTATALETLRTRLDEAEIAKVDAMFRGAGFQGSTAAMMLCDTDMTVTHCNTAMIDLVRDNLDDFRVVVPSFDPDQLVGMNADLFHRKPEGPRRRMAEASFPIDIDITIGGVLMNLVLNRIEGDKGATMGYVLEWLDVTEQRKTAAVLASLEQAQLRADFGPDGLLSAMSDRMGVALKTAGRTPSDVRMAQFVQNADGSPVEAALKSGKAVFGKFHVTMGTVDLLLDGSLSPTTNSAGRLTGFVLLGQDITESETRLRAATEQNERMVAEQSRVMTELKSALTELSDGNLRVRIETAFPGDYEALRTDFNRAVSELDGAIARILASADTILGEADNVSGAADDLSRRTERQAATLEETAAAISELTASVASAASGAKQANDVVDDARDNAATSGDVVRQAVDAMGEIANSSEQISRIIGVIDEIAFQTNLLALNAGVEAARAGDAGRGFAVVASEVRALAQRSSEAAREITDLISTSSEHVKKGVSLVGKAGHALTEIVASVGGIAEHVSGIAASAREQSTGLDEINTAMNQLDQVTQKNVAMFEETMASSKLMTTEATSLVSITHRFQCSGSRATASDTAPVAVQSKSGSADAAAPAERGVATIAPVNRSTGQDVRKDAARPPRSAGNLALAPEDASDDDWEEF